MSITQDYGLSEQELNQILNSHLILSKMQSENVSDYLRIAAWIFGAGSAKKEQKFIKHYMMCLNILKMTKKGKINVQHNEKPHTSSHVIKNICVLRLL